MFDKDELKSCLSNLYSMYNTKQARTTVETLLKIHRNILENPDDIKYRKLKIENKSFSEKIWSLTPGKQFLIICGWLEVKTYNIVTFSKDERLPDILDTLLTFRNIAPRESEWKEHLKWENITDPKLREEELRKKAALEREKELDEFKKDKEFKEQLSKNLREEELRKKAALEREKELDEFKKDKEFREQLSKNIKAQIAADKIARRNKNSSQSVVQPCMRNSNVCQRIKTPQRQRITPLMMPASPVIPPEIPNVKSPFNGPGRRLAQ